MKNGRPPVVFVVDDDAAVRASLDSLVRSAGLDVETFGSAAEFLGAYSPQQPGCLVLDVRMTGMSGLELQKELHRRSCNIPVIIVTGHGDVPMAVKAMKNGAFEFVEKPFNRQLFLEHVRRAIELDHRQRTTDRYVQNVTEKLQQLTRREEQVLAGILEGKLSKQIALELGVSKKTVDAHRANLMRKMEVKSVAALVEQVLAARGPDAASPAPSSADTADRVEPGTPRASGPSAGRTRG